ncbi:hypothetical protein Godav_010425 [Gossypium davidsonii]|uniref:UDP-glycosyltransferases domain-containing protein n=2 Tax=Gossypium TaxID=3633 RepID=A0A7J8SGD4_GOSDV|nr:hypothetical protein [Gossypium davidsonii]MBA0660747.1 hypothetical protein [Gossypium klotzschianum]
MSYLSGQPHFVLFPFVAQGHLIPMIDIGLLLAPCNVIVTIVTTPHNAERVQYTIARAMESGCPIRLVQLQVPGKEVGLQDGVENVDMLVPGLTEKVEFTKAQLPLIRDESWKAIMEPLTEADKASYGGIINTFEELESAYVREYKKIRKSWCIGPVSLSHKNELDTDKRGNKTSINKQECLKWLDSQEPNSVIYACLGSISTIKFPELKELGLGLEASDKPFIWVLRGKNATSNQVEKWIKEDGFEERTKGRGLIIVGWAPQVLILSHSAIGGFLTHCGWNSTIEGISAGVPLITLPLLGDQFCNQKLVVQILKIGVNLGIEKPTMFGDEESGFILKKEVKNAIYQLIDEGNEGIERRKRAKEFGEKAKKLLKLGALLT